MTWRRWEKEKLQKNRGQHHRNRTSRPACLHSSKEVRVDEMNRTERKKRVTGRQITAVTWKTSGFTPNKTGKLEKPVWGTRMMWFSLKYHTSLSYSLIILLCGKEIVPVQRLKWRHKLDGYCQVQWCGHSNSQNSTEQWGEVQNREWIVNAVTGFPDGSHTRCQESPVKDQSQVLG